MRRIVVITLVWVALSAAILAYALRRDVAAGLEGFLAGVLLILSIEVAAIRWLKGLREEEKARR